MKATSIRLPGPTAAPLRHVEPCMGTVFSFQVAAPGVSRSDLKPVLGWLHRMDAMFSTYRSNSQISQLDDGRLRLADASDEVRFVLGECDRFRELTDGYFDARADGRRRDPSGYVKGWAIRSASEKLVAAGSVNHCVNGGGDVVCVGGPAPGRPWRIGISDPFQCDRILRTVVAPGPIAVATSGLAERGAHILDPHTGRAMTELAAVSVAAPDMITADVYATAAVAMGPERAATWLERQPEIVATLATADGAVRDVVGAFPRSA